MTNGQGERTASTASVQRRAQVPAASTQADPVCPHDAAQPDADAALSENKPGESKDGVRVSENAPKARKKGTGKASRKPRKGVLAARWTRRICQGVFLALFFVLLSQTAFRGSFSADPSSTERLGWPVAAFFYFDPLAALLTLLSTWTVYKWMLLSLVVVALTLLFGRVFCGWICPMGTLNQIVAWLWPSAAGKGARRVAANRYEPKRQRIKYYVLYFSLAAALVGSAVGGIMDPFSLLVRSFGLSVLPASQYVTSRFQELTAKTDIWAIVMLGDGVNYVMSRVIAPVTRFVYQGSWFIGLLLIAVLLLNRFVPRFWCRVLCPLGALLGLVSRFSLFGMEKHDDRCTKCNLCLRHCQGADNPIGGQKWHQNECLMCMNCEAVCPEGVIRFGWLPSRKTTETKPDTMRRTAVGAAALGLVTVPLARSSVVGNIRGNSFSPTRIRPPGAVDEPAFLDRCIRCGECMKVCPNNVLHPAIMEAGLEGLWTPVAIPKVGSCDISCVLCGQVCPTGAIREFTAKDRVGTKDHPPIKVGTAFYDHGRCLPWAMQTACIVCEEFCPTSPKAIWVETVTVPVRKAQAGKTGHTIETVELQRPHVDPALCIGCGACEKVCPVVDQAAIRVTSVGESRSKTNVILLKNPTG